MLVAALCDAVGKCGTAAVVCSRLGAEMRCTKRVARSLAVDVSRLPYIETFG